MMVTHVLLYSTGSIFSEGVSAIVASAMSSGCNVQQLSWPAAEPCHTSFQWPATISHQQACSASYDTDAELLATRCHAAALLAENLHIKEENVKVGLLITDTLLPNVFPDL